MRTPLRQIALAALAKGRIWVAPVLVAGVFALGLAAAPAQAEAPTPKTVRQTTDTFRSGGKAITVERFQPAVKGRYPAVLLLPGLYSMGSQRQVFGDAARRYAARGYVVLFIHYFDRTCTKDEDIKPTLARFQALVKQTDGGQAEKHLAGHFQAWTATVRDAVAYARGLRQVDPERIGLVGFSLGAYLALAVAAEEELRIAAVVDFFGGLPRPLRRVVKTFPPVLVLHGDKDQVVPIAEAHALAGLLSARNVPHEVKIYPGVGHVFGDNGGRFALSAALDAERRTSAFLEKHLKGAKAGAAPP